MKRLFILSVALATMAVTAGAQDYDMVVEGPNGETASFLVRNIDRVRVKEDTWTAVAKGDYTCTAVTGNNATGLELFRSDALPNRWKIEHWGGDVDFYFTLDEETGEICVDIDQKTGLTYKGESLYVGEKRFITGRSNEGRSYFDSEAGAFSFCMAYYSESYILGATGANDKPDSYVITEYY